MAEPATEGDSRFDVKCLRQLLKAVPLRTLAYYRKAGQAGSQKRSSRPQSEVRGFSANQAANENQLKFSTGLRTACVGDAQGGSNTILWDKEQLVVMRGKLGTHVRRRGYDRCRVVIGGPGKRHNPVQTPEDEV
jgi:hypothetical protein